MNAKVGAGIAGICIVIILGVAFALTQNQNPSNVEQVEIVEGQQLSQVDTAEIEDSAAVTKSEANFIIDEDGNKKYVISAKDVVEIEEQ